MTARKPKTEASEGLAAWARITLKREAIQALEGDPERNRAALLDLYGLAPDAGAPKRRALAVRLVREALAARSEPTPTEWLAALCRRLRVTDEAFGPFEPTEGDARFIFRRGRKREAFSVAAYLFLRASAFLSKSPQKCPDPKEHAQLTKALARSEARRTK